MSIRHRGIILTGGNNGGTAAADGQVVDDDTRPVSGDTVKKALDAKANLVNGKVPASELPDMGTSWGSITGDLSDQSDLADALDGKANLVGGKVPSGELPYANNTTDGIVGKIIASNGLINYSGQLIVKKAENGDIDAKANQCLPIVPYNLDYAVRSVLPNVTTIPAATSSYSLLDASATTNSHSWTFVHSPSVAPTYQFPTVTDATTVHRIDLIIDFTAVQTYSFEDANGVAILPLFTPSISAGDVYAFRCEWSSVQSKWLIYPCKQGAVSDDYVMRGEVGAANGVAGLDSNGKVPSGELPIARENVLGIVKFDNKYGITRSSPGFTVITRASDSDIDARATGSIGSQWYYRPIVPGNLNYAVTAALSDSNHLTMTAAQQAVAQGVIGAYGTLTGSGAPTTSTVGAVGQRYLDTATSKTYTCVAITNTGTEAEPAWSYTWVDDINAKGGEFNGKVWIHDDALIVGYNTNVTAQGGVTGGQLVVGVSNKTSNGAQCLVGSNLTGTTANQLLVGQSYKATNSSVLFGAGHYKPVLETYSQGHLYIAGGQQQGITVIPAATTAYTLAEGMQSHVPSSASTYTLPAITSMIMADNVMWRRNTSTDGTGYYGWLSGTTNRYTASATPAVGDNTYTNTALSSGAKAVTAIDERTHECILTVRFSSSVLTYAFEDAAGNPITPLPLTGTIADGSVVCFRCAWEALLNSWVVMPVMLGTYAEVTP